jgi:hypothetical protein
MRFSTDKKLEPVSSALSLQREDTDFEEHSLQTCTPTLPKAFEGVIAHTANASIVKHSAMGV